MLFITKEWVDRLVEFAGRRKLSNVSTGEEMIVDVAREEGAVLQEGNAFNATEMNDLEQRIADGFNSLNDSLGGVTQFIVNESTGRITGYKTKVGADTVFPFKAFEFETLVPIVLSKSITISDAIIGKHYMIIRTRGTDLGISDTVLIKSGATTIWESECGITQYAGVDMAYVQANESDIIVNGTAGKTSLIYFQTD